MADPDEWPFTWGRPARGMPPWWAEVVGGREARPTFSVIVDDAQLRAAFEEIGAALAAAWDTQCQAIAKAHAELVRLGLARPVPPRPADRAAAQARALELRRRRNTGPPPPPLGRR